MTQTAKELTWYVAIVTAGIVLTATIWILQTQALTASSLQKDQDRQLQILRELLATKGEGFREVDGKLLVGDYIINDQHEIPLLIREIYGGGVTIFHRDMRVATSLKDSQGNVAIDAPVEQAVREAILRGEPFRGEATIFGELHLVACEPLRTAEGEVLGALAVGVRKETYLAELKSIHLEVVVVSCILIGLFATLTGLLVRRNLAVRAALKNSEDALRLTQFSVANAEISIYRISREGRILFANQAASCALGYAIDELQTMRITDIDPFYPSERWPQHWEELRQSGSMTFETAHRTRDGRLLPMEISAHHLEYDDSEYIFAFARDISDRKRSQNLLKAEKEVLERIAAGESLEQTFSLLCTHMEELSGEGICSVLLLDPESGRLRHCAAPNLPHGYLTALKSVSVAPRRGSCGTAAFLKEQVIVTDIASDPLWAGYSTLPLGHGLRACWSTPILSSCGELYGTFALYYRTAKGPESYELQIVEHATELARIAIDRKRSEEALKCSELALRQSEERFRQIFQQNEDAIILLRFSTLELIDANPEAEKLYGWSRNELRDRTPWGLIDSKDIRTFTRSLSRLPKDGGFRLERLTSARRDGTAITICIWAKVIRLHDDEVLYCSIRDITQRIRLEEEMKKTQAKLIHADKMKTLGMHVSGIAHEINNPNNFIGLNSSLLADLWKDAVPVLEDSYRQNGELQMGGLHWPEVSATVPRLLDGVSRGSQRIAAIVESLKEFVRGDLSGLENPADLCQVVRDAALVLTSVIHRHTDHLHLDLPQGLPPFRGNPQQMEQVVINLLTNALQSLPCRSAGVRIEASFDASAAALILRVRDEGRGMEPSVMEKITEPFFSTRREDGGTGLGLFISAFIVQSHGGSLEFDSYPGRGTTASLKLPVAEASTEPQEMCA